MNLWVLLFEVASTARDGAARAHARDEDVKAALRLLPDLGAGRQVVGLGVGGVVVLVGVEGAGGLSDEALGHFVVAARIGGIDRRRTQHHFGPQRA